MREDLQNIEDVADGFDGSRHDERAAIPPVRSEPLFGSLVLRIEHGWLCWRTETGWLAHSVEIAKFPSCGLNMDDLVSMCERNAKPNLTGESPRTGP